MNIVITLPRPLIDKIVSGEKTVEIRKSKPKNFNPEHDHVSVIEKGTKLAIAWFKISWFEFGSASLVYFLYGENIGVPKKWLRDYVMNDSSKGVWVWHISESGINSYPVCLTEFGLKCSPQSYAYDKICP